MWPDSDKVQQDVRVTSLLHRIHDAISCNMDPINVPPMLALKYQHHGSVMGSESNM
jgi:hypothetical protein